jgi:hypothetical protein
MKKWIWLIAVVVVVLGFLFFVYPFIPCETSGCGGVGIAQYEITLFEYLKNAGSCPIPPLVSAMC